MERHDKEKEGCCEHVCGIRLLSALVYVYLGACVRVSESTLGTRPELPRRRWKKLPNYFPPGPDSLRIKSL